MVTRAITVPEASERLGVTRQHLYRLIERLQIHYWTERGRRFFRSDHIDRLARDGWPGRRGRADSEHAARVIMARPREASRAPVHRLTAMESCRVLGVSHAHLCRLVEQGLLSYKQVGRRRIFSRRKVEDLAREGWPGRRR